MSEIKDRNYNIIQTLEQIQTIKDGIEAGKSGRCIANEMGISQSAVTKFIRKSGGRSFSVNKAFEAFQKRNCSIYKKRYFTPQEKQLLEDLLDKRFPLYVICKNLKTTRRVLLEYLRENNMYSLQKHSIGAIEAQRLSALEMQVKTLSKMVKMLMEKVEALNG